MTQIKVNKQTQAIETIYYGRDKLKGFIEVENILEAEEREGYQAVGYYRNGKVEYEYEKVEIPPIIEDQPTAEDTQQMYESRVDSKIRERYSMSNELAILRQRETKPQEFEEYNRYCEQCKQTVKEEISKEKQVLNTQTELTKEERTKIKI